MSNEFPQGIFFNKPKEGAPDFVRGSLSFDVAKAVAWLQANANEAGYVNVDMKVSKDGKMYLSHWKPDGQQQQTPQATGTDDSAIPF